METWYLVSLVIHLNRPWFSENFLASCSLQQFQVKTSMNACELKCIRLWQATTKYLKKYKLVCSDHVSVRGNNRAKFDYWCGRKTLLFLDYRGFQNGHLGITAKKAIHFDQLRHWQKKLKLTEVSWSTSSNLLPDDIYTWCKVQYQKSSVAAFPLCTF